MKRSKGKRERSHSAANFPASISKRFRPPPPPPLIIEKQEEEDLFKSASSSSPVVMVTGLPRDCTVLELKARLEFYGPISRTRIDPVDGSGYVTFRSNGSAESAISASLDSSFPISIRSKRVLVCRAADPQLVWRPRTGALAPAKLLRGEAPLSKHGRTCKKHTASTTTSIRSVSEAPLKGREIVAYDDLF